MQNAIKLECKLSKQQRGRHGRAAVASNNAMSGNGQIIGSFRIHDDDHVMIFIAALRHVLHYLTVIYLHLLKVVLYPISSPSWI